MSTAVAVFASIGALIFGLASVVVVTSMSKIHSDSAFTDGIGAIAFGLIASVLGIIAIFLLLIAIAALWARRTSKRVEKIASQILPRDN